ncbi:IPT/TIG domain-containing protein [bacterium]|nr:IPT/TIG domain-containing protein [bacterium]
MKSIIKTGLIFTALLLVVTGCDTWDGPTSMYNRPHLKADPPVITSIDPPAAGAGVNSIMINGSNFSASMDSNKVYIDGFQAEIVESSTTMIKIRRPARSGDSTVVKVVNYEADDYAVYEPYRIDPVLEMISGGFLDGSELNALACLEDGTVFFVNKSSPWFLYKIAPDGSQSQVLQTTRGAMDMIVAPDGQLMYFAQSKDVYKIDLGTVEETEWYSMKKSVVSGDFDANGNLYAGGRKSDLLVLTADMTETATAAFNVKKDDILCVRVHGNAVYVLAFLGEPDENNPAYGVWKLDILDAAGSLGPRQLVFDWTRYADNESSILNHFTISPAGMMYIGGDNADPIMKLDLNSMRMEILYKGILTASAMRLAMAGEGALYMIETAESVSLLNRVDLGPR